MISESAVDWWTTFSRILGRYCINSLLNRFQLNDLSQWKHPKLIWSSFPCLEASRSFHTALRCVDGKSVRQPHAKRCPLPPFHRQRRKIASAVSSTALSPAPLLADAAQPGDVRAWVQIHHLPLVSVARPELERVQVGVRRRAALVVPSTIHATEDHLAGTPWCTWATR